MHLVENKNAMNDICIRLSPTRGSISVESYNPDGIISKKEISEIDLYYALNQGYASAATTLLTGIYEQAGKILCAVEPGTVC